VLKVLEGPKKRFPVSLQQFRDFYIADEISSSAIQSRHTSINNESRSQWSPEE